MVLGEPANGMNGKHDYSRLRKRHLADERSVSWTLNDASKILLWDHGASSFGSSGACQKPSIYVS